MLGMTLATVTALVMPALLVSIAIPVAVVALSAALPTVAIAVTVTILRGIWRALKLTQRAAERLNFLFVGPLLNLHVVQHLHDFLHVAQHDVEPLDDR